jgi:hypothetical protein
MYKDKVAKKNVKNIFFINVWRKRVFDIYFTEYGTAFSKSLEQCKYPKLWKKDNVIPIFKKGNNSYPSNYRPISLISCVAKQLISFLSSEFKIELYISRS